MIRRCPLPTYGYIKDKTQASKYLKVWRFFFFHLTPCVCCADLFEEGFINLCMCVCLWILIDIFSCESLGPYLSCFPESPSIEYALGVQFCPLSSPTPSLPHRHRACTGSNHSHVATRHGTALGRGGRSRKPNRCDPDDQLCYAGADAHVVFGICVPQGSAEVPGCESDLFCG